MKQSKILSSRLGKSLWLKRVAGILTAVLLVSLHQPTQALAGPFNCANQSQIPAVECEALVELYNSTDGANWTDNSGWLTTGAPCTWYGVDCNNAHVQDIHLENNNLTGEIPSSLGILAHLHEVWISNNHLSGALPPELGNLVLLEDIFLDGNLGLSGPIPLTFTQIPDPIFKFQHTNLCEPTDAVFQNWLAQLQHTSNGIMCADIQIESASFDENCNIVVTFVADRPVHYLITIDVSNTTNGTVAVTVPFSPLPNTPVSFTISGLHFAGATTTVSIGDSSIKLVVPEKCREIKICDGFTIFGSKYFDANGNGVRDPSEVGIPNWDIQFTDYDGVVYTAITDQDGNYEIVLAPNGLTLGEGILEEILGDYAGILEPTQPPSGQYTVTVTCSGGFAADFGNAPTGCTPIIGGYKFEDTNGNGVWDDDEQALADWPIVLTDSNGDSWATTTNAQGYYEFIITLPQFAGFTMGPATIAELFDANQWVPTTPTAQGIHNVNVECGYVNFNLDFGNMPITQLEPQEACSEPIVVRIPIKIVDIQGEAHMITIRTNRLNCLDLKPNEVHGYDVGFYSDTTTLVPSHSWDTPDDDLTIATSCITQDQSAALYEDYWVSSEYLNIGNGGIWGDATFWGFPLNSIATAQGGALLPMAVSADGTTYTRTCVHEVFYNSTLISTETTQVSVTAFD